ncbi:MAG: biotin transporter BioY [Clostridiales bacterium]|nr:biotin transporter BioY [Clostridiales bacterium]
MSTKFQETTRAADKSAFSTYKLVVSALFAALLCISAYISVPTPLPGSPHITLLNFVIILIALLFAVKEAFFIILVWMLLGALGIPVFIGGGAGIGYLTGPWGGYTVSFLITAIVLPLIRGARYNRIRYTAAAVIGVLLIDVIGMVWLKFYNSLSWSVAFLTGFVSFLPLDLVKAVACGQIVPAFKRVIKEL